MTRQLNDGRLVDSLGSARRDAAHISTLTISYPSLSLFLGGEAITQTKTASHCRKFTLSDLSRRSTDRISGIVASIDYSTSTAVSHGARVCLSLSSEAQKIEKEKTTTRRLGQKAFVLWNLSGCHWDGRRVVPPYCNKGTGGTHTHRGGSHWQGSVARIYQTNKMELYRLPDEVSDCRSKSSKMFSISSMMSSSSSSSSWLLRNSSDGWAVLALSAGTGGEEEAAGCWVGWGGGEWRTRLALRQFRSTVHGAAISSSISSSASYRHHQQTTTGVYISKWGNCFRCVNSCRVCRAHPWTGYVY